MEPISQLILFIALIVGWLILSFYLLKFMKFVRDDNKRRKWQQLSEEQKLEDKRPTNNLINISDYRKTTSIVDREALLDEVANKNLVYIEALDMWTKEE
jgi:hypothetical protein